MEEEKFVFRKLTLEEIKKKEAKVLYFYIYLGNSIKKSVKFEIYM